ncbi:MAG: hypothetical protein JXA71_09425 [Chitinispirillaceae bacterium]|nr:hypothetical protein [Chitinispirillaceae bacterium]
MFAVILSIVLLAALILVAVRLVSFKRPQEDTEENNLGTTGPLIHASGIYSIVRKSPRENLGALRPQEAEVRKYLATINEDINKQPLSDADKQKIITHWQKAIDENIRIIERGDCEGVEFYYLDFPKDKTCPLCRSSITPGQFVTREQLFSTPSIIPPFHLGCTTRIHPYFGKEDLRDTAIMGMAPLFTGSTPPVLPDWKKTLKTIC